MPSPPCVFLTKVRLPRFVLTKVHVTFSPVPSVMLDGELPLEQKLLVKSQPAGTVSVIL